MRHKKDVESDAPEISDPNTGKTALVRDARGEFERISSAQGNDEAGSRAFIEARIAWVANDPSLGVEEKDCLIAELRRAMSSSRNP